MNIIVLHIHFLDYLRIPSNKRILPSTTICLSLPLECIVSTAGKDLLPHYTNRTGYIPRLGIAKPD
jgi:hypothetical protein